MRGTRHESLLITVSVVLLISISILLIIIVNSKPLESCSYMKQTLLFEKRLKISSWSGQLMGTGLIQAENMSSVLHKSILANVSMQTL